MMLQAEMAEVAKGLKEAGVEVDIHSPVCFYIPNMLAEMSVEARPPYCDRGRFMFRATSRDPRRLTIDDADQFPRYYFSTEACVGEILAWIDARELRFNSSLIQKVREVDDRELADSLWDALADLAYADSREGMEYRRVLLGQAQDHPDNLQEGPDSRVKEFATVAGNMILRALR